MAIPRGLLVINVGQVAVLIESQLQGGGGLVEDDADAAQGKPRAGDFAFLGKNVVHHFMGPAAHLGDFPELFLDFPDAFVALDFSEVMDGGRHLPPLKAIMNSEFLILNYGSFQISLENFFNNSKFKT
jgi:hypothetical protein